MPSVGILAKPPLPGICKTRLCPPLTPAEAASLARALLDDTVARVRALPVRPVLFSTVEHDGPRVLRALYPGLEVREQRGADLGARMTNALRELLADDGAALLLGGDAPHAPIEEAVAACARLDGNCAFVGPSLDGGYWTIGMARILEPLFNNVPWSSPEVLVTTDMRARAAGIALSRLAPSRDIDAPEDLAWLRASVEQQGPATRAWLHRWTGPVVPHPRA